MPLNCVGTLFEETAAQAGQPLCCTALRDKCLFDYGTGCQNRGNGREEGILMQQEDAMSVLDKFAAVEIKADVRISEQDKQFCEQQAACTAALHGFQELTFFWEDMLSTQKALPGEPAGPPRTYNHCLIPGGDDGPKIIIQRLRVQNRYCAPLPWERLPGA